MKEKNKEFLGLAAFLLFLGVCVAIVGKIGGDCVADCMEAGGTEGVCYHTCRP